MKNRIILILNIFLLLFAFSYATVFSLGKSEAEQMEIPGSHVLESEITGLVEKGFEERITIVENPSSRSRISYYVQEKIEKKIAEYLGREITVKGIVTNTDNPWKKSIIVSEIIKN